MSIRVMTRVWEHATYKEGALLTLLALADYADDNGVCWPGQHELADKARLGKRQLRNVLHALEGDGEIISLTGRGRGIVTVYCVLSGLDEQTRDARRDWFISHYRKPAIGDTEKGQLATGKGAIGDTEKGQLATGKGAIGDTEKGQLATQKRGNWRHRDESQFSAPECAESPQTTVMQPSWETSVDPSSSPAPVTDQAMMMEMLYELGFTATKPIQEVSRMGLDLETVRASVKNLRSCDISHGAIMVRLKTSPPVTGQPYPRSSRASTGPPQKAQSAKAQAADEIIRRALASNGTR